MTSCLNPAIRYPKLDLLAALLAAATPFTDKSGLRGQAIRRHMWLSCGSFKPYDANPPTL